LRLAPLRRGFFLDREIGGSAPISRSRSAPRVARARHWLRFGGAFSCRTLGLPSRFGGPASVTPKFFDCVFRFAVRDPSTVKPRFSNSRTADARLGMRCLKRQSSRAFSSSSVSMICRCSPRMIAGNDLPFSQDLDPVSENRTGACHLVLIVSVPLRRVGNVHCRSAGDSLLTDMFWEGEKRGAFGPTGNIRKMPRRDPGAHVL
jgi:hypothetical protein